MVVEKERVLWFLSLLHHLSLELKVQNHSCPNHIDNRGCVLKGRGVIFAIMYLSRIVFHA